MEEPQNDVVISPHPGQIPIFVREDGQPQDKRITLAIAGIQGGKTWAGCLWSQLEIQKFPQGIGLICGLSKDQVDQVLVTKFFGMFPQYSLYYNKKERTLHLPTGGKVFFRSLEDPKYIEGITANWAWIDEADLASYKAYLIVRGRTNATRGRILLTSSIADNSWIAEYLERVNPEHYLIVNWESKANPAFSIEEWNDLQEELEPAIFRRRYEAKLSFSTGRVYGRFDFKTMVPELVPADDAIERAFVGMDWGYVDPTALVVVGISQKKNIYVLDDFSVEGASDSQIVAMIGTFRKLYTIKGFYADPQNKSYLKSISGQAKVMIQPGERDIFEGTSLIRNLIFQGRFFVLKRCEHVLWEMKRYKFKEGLMGRAEEPEDKYNHCMDAMRYVLATYPLPSVKSGKKKEVEAVLPDFWLRRTVAYKKELKRQNPLGAPAQQLWIP